MTTKKLTDNNDLTKRRQQLADDEQRMRNGIQTDDATGRRYFTGYAYKTLYDWDQYFEAIVQIYMGWDSELIRNAVTIFLDHQQQSGHIPRSVPSSEFHDPEHVKPFLAQTAWLVHRYYGESDWLLNDTYYPKLKRYLDYWLDDMDSTGNGLSEWMSAPHTGMDNHHERAGHWNDRISKGVDLNCYLVREARAVAALARLYGRDDDAGIYLEKADKRALAIRDLLWHDSTGFFLDMRVQTGDPIHVRAVSGLMPLWAGVATKEQAESLVKKYVLNEHEFWRPWPLPALAHSEPGYSEEPFATDVLGAENTCSWRANTWIPTNYMVYHGLKSYGYHDAAAQLARRTDELLHRAGSREWYTSEHGEGRGLDPFWGWSVLGHFFLFEEQSGENPTVLE